MKNKVLIIDHENRPLSKVRKFFTGRDFEIIKPKETDSVFTICKSEELSAVIVDPEVFGKRSLKFIQNLRDHILPAEVKLFSISSDQNNGSAQLGF